MPFPVWQYTKEVFIVNIIVAVISLLLPTYLHVELDDSIINSIVAMLAAAVWTGAIIYFIGLNKDERAFLVHAINRILHKKQ